MTVYLGSSNFNQVGDQFQIQPPTGFNSVDSVRISNYTNDALVLNNINGDTSSVEYLAPFQQMIYPVTNITQFATMYGLRLGALLPTESILIEWSTDGAEDFIGTYPVGLTTGSGPTTGTSTVNAVITLAADGTDSIPSDGNRLSTTVMNYGPGSVYFDSEEATTDNAFIPSGASITYANGSELSLLADSSGASVAYFGESY